MNTVKVEETGLDIPKLKEVTQINGEWALLIENREGKTLEEMMKVDRANLEKYMSDFVDLQLKVQSKTATTLPKLKDKLADEIRSLKDLMQQNVMSFDQIGRNAEAYEIVSR